VAAMKKATTTTKDRARVGDQEPRPQQDRRPAVQAFEPHFPSKKPRPAGPYDPWRIG
jgi:hypothetical protein